MKTRKFTRYFTDVPVSIAIEHIIGEHQFCMKDISQGGLCVNAHGCIDLNTHLNIMIPVAGQLYNTSGKIAWSQPLDTGQCQLGITFEKQVAQYEIENLIHRH